jgi:hypothetical protein
LEATAVVASFLANDPTVILLAMNAQEVPTFAPGQIEQIPQSFWHLSDAVRILGVTLCTGQSCRQHELKNYQSGSEKIADGRLPLSDQYVSSRLMTVRRCASNWDSSRAFTSKVEFNYAVLAASKQGRMSASGQIRNTINSAYELRHCSTRSALRKYAKSRTYGMH